MESAPVVKIIYEPWNTVVIHEIVQYDLPTLIQLHSLGVQTGQLGRPINWANGVAFRQRSMQHTEEIIKEQLEGRIHWSHLAFAFMPKHEQVITIPEGNVRIPILNVSDNAIFIDLAKWIKKNFKPK